MKKRIRSKDFWAVVTWGLWWGFLGMAAAAFGLSFGYWDISVFLACLSVALGLLAISMSLQSDLRMQSLTAVEINEKMAIIAQHTSDITTNPNVSVPRILLDVEACTKMWKWISEMDKEKLEMIADGLVKAINEKQKSKSYDGYLDKLLEIVGKFKAIFLRRL